MDIRNNLVPKHSIASESELAELTARLGVKIESFPVISIEDPALKDIDVKIGDVIRIDRESRVTKQIEPYYRIVVE
ncbi:hypothetical protein AUJ14_06330 [Candidatus Micrarchaeota archaeon CG1_02_55_22]|nr:MAG: hypothetical protein AUJ14_06330 [Candidatus Micrarchaeota archaeon CG1_02_55_22]